jgi:hypothetical protein
MAKTRILKAPSAKSPKTAPSATLVKEITSITALSEVDERDGSDRSPVRNLDPANAPWSCDIYKDKRFT